MTSKVASASGKGIHPGKENCFQDIFRLLQMARMIPVRKAAYTAQRHAGYSVVSRNRLSEEPSEIQRKFLKIFHMVSRHCTLRQKERASSVALLMMHLFQGVYVLF